MDFVYVLGLFHVQHVAESSYLVGQPSDHVHYFILLLVGCNKLTQPHLLAGRQRSDDKQLRRFEDQFLQQLPLQLYFLPFLRPLYLLRSAKEYICFRGKWNEGYHNTVNSVFRPCSCCQLSQL